MIGAVYVCMEQSNSNSSDYIMMHINNIITIE